MLNVAVRQEPGTTGSSGVALHFLPCQDALSLNVRLPTEPSLRTHNRYPHICKPAGQLLKTQLRGNGITQRTWELLWMVLSFTALRSSYFLWKVFFSWNRGMQQKARSPHLHAGLIYSVDDSDQLGPHSTNLDIKVIMQGILLPQGLCTYSSCSQPR